MLHGGELLKQKACVSRSGSPCRAVAALLCGPTLVYRAYFDCRIVSEVYIPP